MTTSPRSLDDRPVVRLGDPGELITVVPYLLGFYPASSLVVLGMVPGTAPGRTTPGPVVRVDLPDRPGPDGPDGPDDPDDLDEEWLGEVRDRLGDAVLRFTDEAILLAFVDDGPTLRGVPARAGGRLLEALAERLAHDGLRVLDRLVVGRRGYRCTGACCAARPEAVPLPEPSQVPAVSALVLEGRCVLPSREAMTAQVEPCHEHPLAREVRRVLGRREARGSGSADPVAAPPLDLAALERGLDAWRALLGWREDDEACDLGRPGAGALVVAAVRAVDEVEVRDALLPWLAPEVFEADLVAPDLRHLVATRLGSPLPGGRPALARRERVLAGLVATSQVLPDEWAAATLTLTGLLAWRLGDAVLAQAALERALRGDPSYRLARLLLPAVLTLRPYSDLARGATSMG